MVPCPTTNQTQKQLRMTSSSSLTSLHNKNAHMFILHIFDTMQSGLQSAASSYSKSDLETVLDDFFDLFITEHVYTTNSLGALRAQYAEASRQYSLSIFYCPPAQDSDGCHPMTVSLNHYKHTMCMIISASVSLYLKNKLLDDMTRSPSC